jgi:DNA repair ATPase RecN
MLKSPALPPFATKPTALACALAAVAALLTGCGEHKKVKECNSFVAVVNGGVDRVQKNINTAPDGGTAVSELNTLAGEMDAIAAETGKVEVTLPELQKFSKRYQTMVGEIAAAARELAAAVDNVDREKMNSSQQQLDQAVKAEGPLVDELNKFCQAP